MATPKTKVSRTYDALPDTLDFRDKMYVPTLHAVPTVMPLSDYTKLKVPVLDQGTEGACTGFGLATVANYLLRCRKPKADLSCVSARMMYQMAKRYDEWPGERYSGSSARGAMKGWHKHGVCSEDCWPYQTASNNTILNEERAADAVRRPLGAYYRVNHKDLVAMHTAMAEVGILYATSSVHDGWDRVGNDGIIEFDANNSGGHAFAIVAYDEKGFWIQNSWGKTWGKDGFALISYDDWLANGSDVWVARLGAPVVLTRRSSTTKGLSAGGGKTKAYTMGDLRPHIVSIGNNGQLNEGGSFGTSAEEVAAIFDDDFPRITKNWKKKRLLLYAHGGLVAEDGAIQRLAEYREALLAAEVYPVSFIWHSDYWTTTKNILNDALGRRRSEGFLDGAKDFMLDRLDDGLEPLARKLTGKLQWDEMKENAMLATASETGGARLALGHIARLAEADTKLELHIAGHSAGSIFHAPLIQYLTTDGVITAGALSDIEGLGLKIASCTLWAPACTVGLFKEYYLPAIEAALIDRFALFALTDEAEQDDHCGHIYNKSLLYLVSNAFEEKVRIPLIRDGVPVLGMEKFLRSDARLKKLFKDNKAAELIFSPNSAPVGSIYRSTASEHGAFDDDEATVVATLGRILNKEKVSASISFERSKSSLQDRRRAIAGGV